MTEIEISQESKDDRVKRLGNFVILRASEKHAGTTQTENPWVPDDVDKFGISEPKEAEEFHKTVNSCRFFYRRDPLASIVLNRMVEIAINELQLLTSETKDTEIPIYTAIIPDLKEFLENSALEYLISGLVLPNITMRKYSKKELNRLGVKYKTSLTLPDFYWLRDPTSVIINTPFGQTKPSYFVKIPTDLKTFIQRKGVYKDGTEDKDLYKKILAEYPQLVKAVSDNKNLVPLDDDVFAIRRRYLSDSPYPTPYLYPALESMRHKRNLRRMDYSVSARVISAIQHFKVGNDEYPLVDEDDIQIETLREQIKWRDSNGEDIERIFQLFTNHTVDISWVYPDTKLLLDSTKYTSVNADIMYALGFPKILITGETERSGSSDPNVATLAPARTMENMRDKIIQIAREVLYTVYDTNKLSTLPEIRLAPINLLEFKDFIMALENLYKSGNLSRENYSKVMGYDFTEEAHKIKDENDLITQLDIPEFAPVPHSNTPEKGSSDDSSEQEDDVVDIVEEPGSDDE